MATMFRHSSLVKGVSFNKTSKKWIGQFMLNGQRHYIGSFKEEAQAAQAVNRARINAMMNSSLRHEIKDELNKEKSQINKSAPYMSPVMEWTDLTLNELKDHAANNGITPDDVDGDKRCRENWIGALKSFDVRPMTEKEPEIDAAIQEIDDMVADLDKDEEKDRKQSDQAVLDLPEEEWAPCAGTNEKNPAYYWCNSGFLYTLYPAEGYTIWRYDDSVPSNNKPIGVWIGPEMDEDEDHLERPCEVTVDKEAGTYRKTVRVSEGAAEEVDEEAAETGSPPIEDRVNIMLEIARMKRAKRWMEELARTRAQ